MKKTTLDYIKRRLVQDLEKLLKDADCNLDGLSESKESLPDLIDVASNLIARSLSQNICERDNRKIRMIERALGDIADGVYGICQHCGEDIAVKRLKAHPTARHCIECKTEIETQARLTGR